MLCAVAGDPSGKDLAAFGYKLFQAVGVFVVDKLYFVGAEAAGFASTGRLAIGIHSAHLSRLSYEKQSDTQF